MRPYLKRWSSGFAILFLGAAHAQVAHQHIDGEWVDGVTRAEVIGDVDGVEVLASVFVANYRAAIGRSRSYPGEIFEYWCRVFAAIPT